MTLIVPRRLLPLVVSGNELTDLTRFLNVEGDGAARPGGTGFWPAKTNIATNGGLETNTTNYAVGGSPASTIARSTAWSTFGAAALAITNLDNDNFATLYSLTFPAAGTYVMSAYVKTPAGMASSLQLSAQNYTGFSMGTAETIAAGLTARISRTITVVAGDLAGQIALYKNGAAEAGPVYLDGLQVELGTVATPYIETDGSTATRSAARGRMAVAGLFSATQGAVAVRWSPGIANTALTSGYAVLFELVDDADNLVRGLYSWADNRYELHRLAAAAGSPHTKAHTFSADSSQEVVFAWTATGLTISVAGGAFDTPTANTAIPTLTAASMDIGSNAGSASHLHGRVRHLTTFEGTLADADAAARAALPDRLEGVRGFDRQRRVLGWRAAPTAFWDGRPDSMVEAAA